MKHKLVDFVIQFMEEVDKEISEMKLFVGVSLEGSSSSVLIILLVECSGPIRCRVVLDTLRLNQGSFQN